MNRTKQGHAARIRVLLLADVKYAGKRMLPGAIIRVRPDQATRLVDTARARRVDETYEERR